MYNTQPEYDNQRERKTLQDNYSKWKRNAMQFKTDKMGTRI